MNYSHTCHFFVRVLGQLWLLEKLNENYQTVAVLEVKMQCNCINLLRRSRKCEAILIRIKEAIWRMSFFFSYFMWASFKNGRWDVLINYQLLVYCSALR